MRHADHEPGTREDCEECMALAYEPGWYKVLRDERVGPPDSAFVRLPEPDEPDVDVVPTETPSEHVQERR
jgi:hypothetical protein